MNGPDLKTLTAYFRLMNTNGTAQVYHAALGSGVLTALDRGAQSAHEIADVCQLQEAPTCLLLEALCAMEVVERIEVGYKLTDVARMLLYSEYRELGNQYWRALPNFLKTGQPIRKMDDVGQSEEAYQTQAAMLGWMLSHAAEAAADILQRTHPRDDLRILDLGAGSAVWSLTLAQRSSESRVTAIDWPSILEVAKETAASFGLTDRLTTLAGNLQDVPLAADAFDLAIVANVTHLQTVEGNAALFGRIHRCLDKGGEVVVIDAFPGASSGNIPFALYHLGLALRTEHGKVHALESLQAILEAQRFTPGTLTSLDVPPGMVGMLVAQAIK
ncbi:MAG: class I SAM-dependent methyltransferase [Planctomycetaceae bacterium]|nr:class I SAM-dependent methyltransferase [Planctomycetales bacterium]MCB9926317.1 class I SAM-dependent methyltransferase [Planctomycetaceae bacterium]